MKYCKECGCIIPDDHESDTCEVCQDERDGTISDGVRGDTS